MASRVATLTRGITEVPAPKGKIVPEPPEWWPRPVGQVRVQRITPRGSTYAVDKVHVWMMGHWEVAGFVVGRYNNWQGANREWDHVLTLDPREADNADTQVRLVYPTTRRQTAIGALIEHGQREGWYER